MKVRALVVALVCTVVLGVTLAGCGGFFSNGGGGGGGSVAHFAYVANSGSPNIQDYTVNQSNGVLTSTGTTTTAGAPVWMDFNDAGTLLYAIDNATSQLEGFTINRSSSGSLTAVAGTPITAGQNPIRVTVDPGSRFLFIADRGNTVPPISGQAITMYPISNSSTGALGTAVTTPLSSIPAAVLLDPAAKFLFVPLGPTGINVYQVASSGALTLVTGSPFTHSACSTEITDVSIEPTEHFVYVADHTDGSVCAFSFNSSTGVLTQLGSVSYPTGGNPVNLAVNFGFTFLYAVNGDPGAASIAGFLINNDGTLTSVGSNMTTGGLNKPTAVAMDPSGFFLYVPNSGATNVSFYTINTSTGVLTSQGTITAGTTPTDIVVTK